MRLPFTKMHGLGNDFIILDCRTGTWNRELGTGKSELGNLAQRLCHRRFGIGADQMILLYDSVVADFRMRILNSDGSEVEMCGNGIRCLAKYIWERGLSDRAILSIETAAGIIKPERSGELVRFDMGEPVLEPDRIPVKIVPGSGFQVPLSNGRASRIIDFPLNIFEKQFRITCVSMGNPHAVIFVEDTENFDLKRFGPAIENHALFPKRTNVEFVRVMDEANITMRVWERGAGETMACGTGASAAMVAAALKGLTGKKVNVALPGGSLIIEWKEDNHVFMTGPAVEVFEGSAYI